MRPLVAPSRGLGNASPSQADSDGIPDGLALPLIVGIVTSGLSGWLAVWGTLKLIRTRSFIPFVIYRVALGTLVLLLIATGVRSN